MRNLLLVGLVTVSFTVGLHIGKVNERDLSAHTIHTLAKQVERFENPYVFHNAEKVARITGTSLYQVLTGKLDRTTEE